LEKEFLKILDLGSSFESIESANHIGRKRTIHLDDERSLKNHGKRENRKDDKSGHKEAALHEELDKAGHRGKEGVQVHGVKLSKR
jgi:hypothetical protein